MAMRMVAQTEGTDLASLVTAAVKSITMGIAPHAGGREREEYSRNVPVWLRHKAGLPADEVAAMLAAQRPELGIESENDLYAVLEGAQLQRRDAQPRNGGSPAKQTSSKGAVAVSTTFDATAAREAVQTFAEVLESMDETIIDQLRDAWKRASDRCGYKALGRYLVTGDLAAACRSFDRMAVN